MTAPSVTAEFMGSFPVRDRALRIFFVGCFLFSGFTWYTDHWISSGSLFTPLFYIFAEDMSGRFQGLDASYLAWDFTILNSPPWNACVLFLMTISCIVFLRDRTKTLGAALLLVTALVITGSLKGRAIAFDMVCYALVGYLGGCLMARSVSRLTDAERSALPWLTAASCTGIIYSSSVLCKAFESGLSWMDALHASYLFQVGKFRFDVGTASIPRLQFLTDYFLQVRSIGAIGLFAVLFVEAGSIFMVLLGRRVSIYLWALALLHVGMIVVVSVVFRPLFSLVLALAVPWHRLRLRRSKRGSAAEPLLAKAALPALTPTPGPLFRPLPLFLLLPVLFSVSFTAVSWSVPTSSKRNNVGLIWPFSRFNMFGWTSRPRMNLYYLRDAQDRLLDAQLIRDQLRMQIFQVNTYIFARRELLDRPSRAAEFFCSLIQSRAENYPTMAKDGLVVWTRELTYDEKENRVEVTDRKVASCS